MKAVILAAGIGSRLRPLTDAKPKCLIRVCGKPLLDYQIEAYRRIGVSEIVIVTGFRGDLIAEHVRHMKSPKIRVIENIDFESTNNMYSLYLARESVAGQPFYLNNADLAVSPTIIEDLAAHSAADAIAVDVGNWNAESMKVVERDGVLVDISKEIVENDALGCSIDFYKFSSAGSTALFRIITETIEAGERNSWTEVAIRDLMVAGGVGFQASPTLGQPWVEVDNYTDLMQAELTFSPFDREMPDIQVAFVDLDGTLFIGESPIEGAAEAIDRLKAQGVRVYFLSNNSSRDKAAYVAKLSKLGISAALGEVILSSDGAIEYLRSLHPSGVFVLGTAALAQQASDAGLPVGGPDGAEYVLVGYDTELTYDKLAKAAAILNAGADMVATHQDIACPTENGPIPDIGAMLELLRMTTGKAPLAVMGKPNVEMVSHVIADLPPMRVAVIGDRPYTDLELARRLGAHSILVLSGETTRDDVEHLTDYPSAVIPSIAALGKLPA